MGILAPCLISPFPTQDISDTHKDHILRVLKWEKLQRMILKHDTTRQNRDVSEIQVMDHSDFSYQTCSCILYHSLWLDCFHQIPWSTWGQCCGLSLLGFLFQEDLEVLGKKTDSALVNRRKLLQRVCKLPQWAWYIKCGSSTVRQLSIFYAY